MSRPYIICHILSSIDGRIEGSFMGSSAAGGSLAAYARMQQGFNADAIAYGSTTTKGFVGSKKPMLSSAVHVASGDFVAVRDAASYYVSIDPAGEIAWRSGTFRRAGRPDAHVIELLTELTPEAYKTYLCERGVSYIVAGSTQLDLPMAMRKLKELFGIERLLLCGGGVTDGAFLSAGLIDELSVVVAPVTSGQAGVSTIFDESHFSKGAVRAFKLVKAERVDGDGLHLVYRAK